MNLKQNIDNTNELKNKVKLANTRIKETIIRGGYDFKSLDKAPERITDLLGQYSKVAMGTLDKRISLYAPDVPSIKVTIPCEFKIKRIMLSVDVDRYGSGVIDSKKSNDLCGSSNRIRLKALINSDNSITFSVERNGGAYNMGTIREYIAIG